MLQRTAYLSFICTLAALALACSDDSNDGADAARDAGAAATVEVTGYIRSFAAGSNETPIAGASICLLDDDDVPCVTSASDGTFTLPGVPTYVRTALIVTATDHLTALIPAVVPTGSHPSVNVDMVSDSVGAALAPLSGTTWPLGDTGLVTCYAKSPVAPHGYVAGASVQLVSGQAHGIVYAGADETPDSTLMATTTAGWGVFGNAETDSVTLRYRHATLDCSRTIWGWPTSDDAFEVPVRAGMLTFALAWCG